MRVQTEEWRRFIPGVRMYKGKMTLFYNGEILYDEENGYLIYTEEERLKWEVIIILPGVEIIPEETFRSCKNVETVIMSDTVRRIEAGAFFQCFSLEYIRLSRTLEYIGESTFDSCDSLHSIFIPPSCREIGDWAFFGCKKLIIFVVPTDTELDGQVIANTTLIEASPFETDEDGEYLNFDEVNEWIKNINGDTDEFALHRACSSYNPIIEIIHEIVTRQGLQAFYTKNELGITPLQYLAANPFAEDIDQRALVKRYVFEMMGEVVY